MKPINTIDRRGLPRRTPGLAGSPSGSRRLLAAPHAAPIKAVEIEKYDAAVEIYRDGGCRLREIERTKIARRKRTEPVAEAASGQPPPEAVDPPSMATGVFRSNGEYWTVGLQGSEAFIKDRKGLRYIADLLCRPGVEIHALDLVTAGRRPVESASHDEPDRSGTAVRWRPISDYLRPRGDAGPILDRQAMAAYKRRLAELRTELEACETHGDEDRVSRVEKETNELRRELRRAFGLGSRPRFAADVTERARINVTRNISLTIERIGEANPELGRYLDASIKTGWFCCYRPAFTQPISWNL